MGSKERAFGPLPSVTLEELVPPEHFYRHLERSLSVLATLRWVIEPEETYLTRRFGPEYQQYRSRVRRWI